MGNVVNFKYPLHYIENVKMEDQRKHIIINVPMDLSGQVIMRSECEDTIVNDATWKCYRLTNKAFEKLRFENGLLKQLYDLLMKERRTGTWHLAEMGYWKNERKVNQWQNK